MLYALAMGAASVAAVGFGRLYDRVGLRGLLALPVLAAVVPVLSFSPHTAAFTAGAVVWGAGMGIHDSYHARRGRRLRPGRPPRRRIRHLHRPLRPRVAGRAALIGLLYEHSTAAAVGYIAVIQLAALALIPVLRRAPDAPAYSPQAGRVRSDV